MAPASTPKAPVKKGKRPYTKRKKYNSLEEQLEARSKQKYESEKRSINRKRAARGESPVKPRIVRHPAEDWSERDLAKKRKQYHERKKRHSVGPILNQPPIAPVVAPPVVAAVAVDPPLAAAGPHVVDGAEPPLGGGAADTASPSV